jgi:micrococcal nuclease
MYSYCAKCGFRPGWKSVFDRKHFLPSLWILFFLLIYPLTVHPHPWLLDGYGCHYNSDRGEYHCHQGVYSGQLFESREEMLRKPREGSPFSPPSDAGKANYHTVTRVVDGYTLVLKNRDRVRLIGVETPETKDSQKPGEDLGREATAFTRLRVQGKRVRLEFEQTNEPIDHKDNHGRTLAYVYLENGTFLNAEIIKQGYGIAYTRIPSKYLDEFSRYEQEAREQGKGLWSKINAKPVKFTLKVLRSTPVYSSPSRDSKQVATISAGTRVQVVNVQGEWVEIRSKHGRPPGFIKRDSAAPTKNR